MPNHVREKHWYQIGTPPVRVDILMSIDGVVFDDAWARRVESIIGDIEAFFISREDLITAKTAAGRPQDLVDVQTLIAYQSEKKSEE